MNLPSCERVVVRRAGVIAIKSRRGPGAFPLGSGMKSVSGFSGLGDRRPVVCYEPLAAHYKRYTTFNMPPSTKYGQNQSRVDGVDADVVLDEFVWRGSWKTSSGRLL
jgi:hypothetical protein